MKPLILGATRTCGSPWVPVRDSRRVVVRGLGERSFVKLEFGDSLDPLQIHEDGEYELPGSAGMVKGQVNVLDDGVSVDVDLE